MNFRKTSFKEILSYFKLICLFTKMHMFSLLRNIKICDRAMKLDALGNFVPLYFSLHFNFLLPLFPGAIVVYY